MAIKLKNRTTSSVLFILASLLLGYSVITALNAAVHSDNISKPSYYESEKFINQLSIMSGEIYHYHVYYKDYSKKSLEEKVTSEEILLSKRQYEENLKYATDRIAEDYKYRIDDAERGGNKEWAKTLTEQRNKEIEEAKKQYTRSDEDIRKELVIPKDNDYKRLTESLNSNRGIEYYYTDKKSGEIYTNIPQITKIDTYIKENALYYKKFPQQLSDYKDIRYDDINRFIKESQLEGYFIVPGNTASYNPIHKQSMQFDYIKQRLHDEIIIGVFTLIASLILFILSGIFRPSDSDNHNHIRLYSRIPLELRLILIGSITMGYLNLFFEYNWELMYDSGLTYFFFIAASCLFLMFMLLNLKGAVQLFTSRSNLRGQWNSTIIYRLWTLFKNIATAFSEAFIFKNTAVYVLTISALATLAGMFFTIFAANIDDDAAVIGLFGFLLYLIFVPRHVFKQIGYFNKILKGSEAIISGDLNYVIEEKGKGLLSRLAHNINNMKSGLKNSLEGEMKSERLKSELITNVSHDLKTPLTSIINYVDLLKRGDLTQEEVKDYISVLDRKTQRLKILIEDLFEASKMASGAVELNLEKVDVSALLKQTLAEFDEKIANSSLTFRATIPQHKIFANLDGKKTWRVFENLVSNILKYSQSNTRVYIDLSEEENRVVIIMKNISAYEMDFDKDEIFERFKRGDQSRHTEGSGLGLAIAKSIVELQGGKLSIEIDGDLFKVIVEFYK